MVVVCRHTGRIVAEAIGVYVRRLRLELSGELADVVLSKEIANQWISLLARKTKQAREALAEPRSPVINASPTARRRGVIRKGMPLGTVNRVQRRAFPQKSSMFIVRRGGDCRLDHAATRGGSVAFYARARAPGGLRSLTSRRSTPVHPSHPARIHSARSAACGRIPVLAHFRPSEASARPGSPRPRRRRAPFVSIPMKQCINAYHGRRSPVTGGGAHLRIP